MRSAILVLSSHEVAALVRCREDTVLDTIKELVALLRPGVSVTVIDDRTGRDLCKVRA